MVLPKTADDAAEGSAAEAEPHPGFVNMMNVIATELMNQENQEFNIAGVKTPDEEIDMDDLFRLFDKASEPSVGPSDSQTDAAPKAAAKKGNCTYKFASSSGWALRRAGIAEMSKRT